MLFQVVLIKFVKSFYFVKNKSENDKQSVNTHIAALPNYYKTENNSTRYHYWISLQLWEFCTASRYLMSPVDKCLKLLSSQIYFTINVFGKWVRHWAWPPIGINFLRVKKFYTTRNATICPRLRAATAEIPRHKRKRRLQTGQKVKGRKFAWQ